MTIRKRLPIWNIQMGGKSMNKSPEIIVFAGPNGSGKSTITKMTNIIEPYINADDIKRSNHCSDLEAAQMAEIMRNKLIQEHRSFTFETVLSTERGSIIPNPDKSTHRLILTRQSL